MPNLIDRVKGGFVGSQIGMELLREATRPEDSREINTQEAGELAELTLALEDIGFRELTASGFWNFNRQTLRRLTALARVMYLINPLIRRATTVQELYVWGSGCRITDEDPDVSEVLSDFFEDPRNQAVIGEAWPERERDQRTDGNQFFVFFRNKRNGRARVRLIPFDQIEYIVYNPEDSKEPWFYYRTAMAAGTLEGQMYGEPFEDIPPTLYPDINYDPVDKPAFTKSGTKIEWDSCVIHAKTGGLSVMRFGLPELYSALNWAIGYKKILENFATILSAYARMAMKVSGLPGKKGVAGAKTKLNTAINNANFNDNNTPNNTAGWGLLSGGVDVQAVKTAGSTTGPDEARALRSMVAAGTDTPEHFFGDSDIGNFATSTTLDRPTELKMVARQKFWMYIILQMCDLLVKWSAVAPQGKLRKAGFKARKGRDEFDGTYTTEVIPPSGRKVFTTVIFPPILQRDVVDRVRAVVQAATLGGSKAEGIIPDRRYLFQLICEALGEPNIEHLVNKYYPQSVTQGFIDPADVAKDEAKAAQGKLDLGIAALKQASVAQQNADKPTPKPVAAPHPAPAPAATK